MCGIVGFVGREEAAPILLDGLSRLEYRGYDSAGIAVYNREQGLRVGLIGPNAHRLYNQLGDYTPPMEEEAGITPLQGLQELLKDSPTRLTYHPGCAMFGEDPQMLQEGLKTMEAQDVIIAVVGGTSSRFSGGRFQANGALASQEEPLMDCGENVDDCRLRLPGDQLALLKALSATGKPVITVLIGGRPYEMEELEACSQAVFCCFYPGPLGGQALAELIFGLAEPAGRLCVSLPDHAGQLPVYYNPKDSYRAGTYYNGQPPRYRFGCGLSYAEFSYRLIEDSMRQIRFRISNISRRPGWAVPQLYLHRTQGVVTARYRQLCGFAKEYLLPGQSRDLTIPIPLESLRQWDSAMRPCLPGGRIQWFLADHGRTFLEGEFQITSDEIGKG